MIKILSYDGKALQEWSSVDASFMSQSKKVLYYVRGQTAHSFML